MEERKWIGRTEKKVSNKEGAKEMDWEKGRGR